MGEKPFKNPSFWNGLSVYKPWKTLSKPQPFDTSASPLPSSQPRVVGHGHVLGLPERRRRDGAVPELTAKPRKSQ